VDKQQGDTSSWECTAHNQKGLGGRGEGNGAAALEKDEKKKGRWGGEKRTPYQRSKQQGANQLRSQKVRF